MNSREEAKAALTKIRADLNVDNGPGYGRHIDSIAAQLVAAMYAGYDGPSENDVFTSWLNLRERVSHWMAADRELLRALCDDVCDNA